MTRAFRPSQLPASQAKPGGAISTSSATLSKEEAGLVAALKSYELQEWLRVLCRMHVLTQQMLLGGLEYDELLPLWAKRMRVILTPPSLFESIKMARAERGVTWHVIETAKLVAGDNGLVAVATGKDETYTVLDRDSKLQGALSALFGKMWDYPPLSDIVQAHNRFMLIATSIKAVYDHTARKMELQARLVVAQDGNTCTSSTTVATLRLTFSSIRSWPRRQQSVSAHSLPPPELLGLSRQWLLHQAKHPLRQCGLQKLPTHPHKQGRRGVGATGGRGAPMATARVGTQTGRAGGPAITDPLREEQAALPLAQHC